MLGDFISTGNEDETWSNWICPNCKYWHLSLDCYDKVDNNALVLE